MNKQIKYLLIAAAVAVCPTIASAYEFGVIDSAKVFKEYKVTKQTKETLEKRKDALQKELEGKKASVKVLDDEYTDMAKKIQDLRSKKKEKEAKDLEAKFSDLRKQMAKASGELQKFFEESQRELYALEEKEMGSVAKDVETKVEKVIQDISKKNKLKAVFAKPTTFWIDEKAVYDMTDEVIKTLNK